MLRAHQAKLVGLPSSAKRFAKFLVKPSNTPLKLPVDVTVQEFMVEKVYIKAQNPTDDTIHFARKRHPMYSPEMNVYGITTVTTHEDGTKLETKRIIKRSDYKWLIETQRDPTRVIVRQRRVCFLMAAEQRSPPPPPWPTWRGLCLLVSAVAKVQTARLPLRAPQLPPVAVHWPNHCAAPSLPPPTAPRITPRLHRVRLPRPIPSWLVFDLRLKFAP